MRKSRIASLAGRASRLWPIQLHKREFWKRRLNIFYLHGVETPRCPLGGCSTIAEFRVVLRQLKTHFHLISLSDLLINRDSEHDLPLGTLTIDDGLDVFRSGVHEALGELNIPCTAFLITNCVGNSCMMWHHRFRLIEVIRGSAVLLDAFNTRVQEPNGYPALRSIEQIAYYTKAWPEWQKEEFVEAIWAACRMPALSNYLECRPYFEWNDVERWLSVGHEVGLHTASHPFCSQLSEHALEAELVEPAHELIRRIGCPRIAVSYPFGDRPLPHMEKALISRRIFSCLLGIRGPSMRGCSPWALERMNLECGMDDGVFGRGLVRTTLHGTSRFSWRSQKSTLVRRA